MPGLANHARHWEDLTADSRRTTLREQGSCGHFSAVGHAAMHIGARALFDPRTSADRSQLFLAVRHTYQGHPHVRQHPVVQLVEVHATRDGAGEHKLS